MRCHEECLGGCEDPTAKRCRVCRNYRILETGDCVKKCPDNLFVYFTLCVNADYCTKHQRTPVLGECRQNCDSLESNNNNRGNRTDTPSHCSRSCPAVEVDSLEMSDYVRGCQIITGDLIIRIISGDINTQKSLERNLGEIEEVYGKLKIYRSHAITSLSFLRNLRIIHGNTFEKTNYTFQIVSNDNLQELWNFHEKKTLQLSKGNLLVHYNSKLCLSQVHELQNKLGTNKSDDFISTESNGYEQTCKSRAMVTFAHVLNHTSVQISWENLNVTDKEKVLGSIIYYVVAPERNVTYRGMDTCVQ